MKRKTDRGFGFITAQNGVEYFFHATGCDPTYPFEEIEEGDQVLFTIEQSNRGPRAVRVERAGR